MKTITDEGLKMANGGYTDDGTTIIMCPQCQKRGATDDFDKHTVGSGCDRHDEYICRNCGCSFRWG